MINLAKSVCLMLLSRKNDRNKTFAVCYERDFMLSLSDNNQTDIIEAFK